jgi:type VI secretion system protein VasG
MSTINLKTLIQKLNPTCQRSLEAAAGMCLSHSHYNVEIEHWLLKLLEIEKNDISLLLKHSQIDIHSLIQDLSANLQRLKTGNAQSPALSQRLVDLLREALLAANLEYLDTQIRSGYVLYALLNSENLQRIASSLSPQFSKIMAPVLRLELPQWIANSIEQELKENNGDPALANLTKSPGSNKTPALNQYTRNLTELARQKKIDPVIGREDEIRQIIDILTRRRQNNPILTGEPGVGKTAVVEGFALLIAQGKVPSVLQQVAVHVLDLGLLQAGAGIKGEFENRLKSVIQEVKSSPHPIILFIDEAHTLIGAGAQAGQGDAANLLKPELARGELRTIAATTWAEYKKYFEQDAALTRRFQVIKVDEPNEEVAVNMVRGLVSSLEQHHQVRILDEAVIAAVRLSTRYLPHRQLPDKAISVLDTASASLAIREAAQAPALIDCQRRIDAIEIELALLKRETATSSVHKKRLQVLLKEQQRCQYNLENLKTQYQKEQAFIFKIRTLREQLETMQSEAKATPSAIKATLSLQNQLTQQIAQLKKFQRETPLLHDCVDAQAIAEVISGWTGIPLGRMLSNDLRNVLQLTQRLQERIVGQAYALKTVAQHIHTSRAQLSDPRKPLGVFLFVGPSGVGKTETALALAEFLYGSEQNMTVINLSEFKEEHKVSLLLGSPPGYVGYGEGGVLTEAVRRRPYSLVLLDEVEKAHPGVQDIFYQAFDKGILQDGQGRDINFKNTVIILTSNVGGELITKLCNDPEALPDTEQLLAAIQPELLKKFKAAFLGRVSIVPYLPLNLERIQKIAELQLQRIQKRVAEHYRIQLSYDPDVITEIALRSQEMQTGARNIDHVLTHTLLPKLSACFLNAVVENKKINSAQISLNAEQEFVCKLN